MLGQTMGADELADSSIPLDTLVWRLFNEEDEVRVLTAASLVRGCRCSPDYIASVLSKFPPDEQRAMADENGMIVVDCAFCAQKFPVPVADHYAA